MARTADLRRLLGTELPLIQAPMAGVQVSPLAVAVCNAGGLGSLPCAMLTVDAMRKELAALKAKTSKPYNVNFFCHTPPSPNASAKPPGEQRLPPTTANTASTPALPAGPVSHAVQRRGRRRARGVQAGRRELPFRPAVGGAAGARARPGREVLSSATTVDEARWLEAHGVDAIIAQGARGRRASRHVPVGGPEHASRHVRPVPQIVRAVKVPVIAAGGIADARGRRRRHRARRRRRTDRHRLPAVPRSHHQRRASRRAEEPSGARHGAHQPFHWPRPPRPNGVIRSWADQRGGRRLSRSRLPPLLHCAPRRRRRARATSRRCGPARTPSGCKEIPAADADSRARRRTLMGKARLEAFSDGVIAIIITIMVLEMKVPHGDAARGAAAARCRCSSATC